MPVFQLPNQNRRHSRRKNADNFINPRRAHVDRGFDGFYRSSAWIKFRQQIAIERGAVCEDKEHEANRSRNAGVELDHIVELVDGGAPLDRSNVMFRCRSCHVRKTQQAKRDRNEREYWSRRDRQR